MSFGAYSQYLSYASDVSRREFMVLAPMLLVALIFGILPNIIFTDLHVAVTQLLYSIEPSSLISDNSGVDTV